MKNWFNKYYRTIIISTFLVPIITVAVVSISHVTKWYGISNPVIWAVYLSIGIEIAALSALAAISADMGKKVYFPFGIVTLIQFIGNIYYTYYFIDIDSKSFTSWVELVSPLIEFMGVESTDLVGHRRFLSVFSGGMLPLISLSFLHMLVKFTEEDRLKYSKSSESSNDNKDINFINSDDLIGEISKVRLTNDDLNRIENFLLKNKKGKIIPKKREKNNRPKIRAKKVSNEMSETNSILKDDFLSTEIIEQNDTVKENKLIEQNDNIEQIETIEENEVLEENEILLKEKKFDTISIENVSIEEPDLIEIKNEVSNQDETNDENDSIEMIESEEKKKK